MTNVNSPRFWTKNAKTSDCLNLSFFIILIDHFYSRHSIQAKCWDAWEAAKKNSNLFDHHLHEMFEPHSGTDYQTGPNFPNTKIPGTWVLHSWAYACLVGLCQCKAAPFMWFTYVMWAMNCKCKSHLNIGIELLRAMVHSKLIWADMMWYNLTMPGHHEGW